MSKLTINIGSLPNDGSGDTLRDGASKINSNFNELYSSLGDGSSLVVGLGKTVISFSSGLSNVGIGSSLPGSKLDVSGDVYISGVSTANKLFASFINGTSIYSSGVSTFYSLDNVYLNVSGITTSQSYYIGVNEVISSTKQLKNINSIDSTTKSTLETALSLSPNDFVSLNVSGISSLGYSSPGLGIIVGKGSTSLLVEGTSSFLNNVKVLGTLTATNFSGNIPYSNISGIATYATRSGIATYATTSGIATYAPVSGVSTVSQGITGTPNINVGVVTATFYYGDGRFLSGIGTDRWFVNNSTNTLYSLSNVGIATTVADSVLEVGSTISSTRGKNITSKINGILVSDKVVGIHTLSIPVGDYGNFTPTQDAFGIYTDTIFDCLYEPGGKVDSIDYGVLT